jgi:hypothetical protein
MKADAKQKQRANAQAHSPEARRSAAVILEALSGLRTSADAAAELGVSLSRYYVLETRALDGLIAACEPRTRGRTMTPEKELEALRKEVHKQRTECQRYQALHRVAQRSMGITEPAAPQAKGGRKRRKRKPVVRALQAVRRLAQESASAPSAGEKPSQAGG